ncbi:RlpA-like double-psi beta-barrel-protein domain-containing protein-containing protein [Cunninghamella echinulata]|nr:RlpA-like double-psi beta-barrel-protein domain-containing protein-containing protein [Cunninghamella echinulata]
MKLASYLTLFFATIFAIVCANEINSGVAKVMKFENESELIKRGGRGTWYTGSDLKNAACYGRKGLPTYSATVHSMIGAMAMREFENCYKCMKITNNQNKSRSVVVRIVDKCAGCKVGKAIDLTPAAFKKLGSLDLGVLDISWKPVKCTGSKLYPSKPKF